MDKSRSISKIHVRYKRFQKEQRDIWESFCLIDFYSPKIKEAVKEDIFPQLSFERVWNDTSKVVKKDDIYAGQERECSYFVRPEISHQNFLKIVFV